MERDTEPDCMMLKEVSSIFKLIGRNWITLLFFEIFYKTFGFILVFPSIQYLLSLLPGLAGVSYLGQENIGQLLHKPAAVLLGLGILFLLILYITCEITAFFLLCEKGWQNERITLPVLGKQALVHTVHLLKPCKAGVLSMFPVLMLSGFSLVSGYLKKIRIPEFILEFIRGNLFLYSIYITLLLILNMLFFLYIFGLPAIFFSGCSFSDSWRESLRLLHGRKLRFAGKTAVMMVLFTLLFLSLAFLTAFILGIYTKTAFAEESGRLAFQLYLMTWARISQIVGGTLVSAFLCAIIVFFYHRYRGEARHDVLPQKTGAGRRFLQGAGTVFLVLTLLLFSETEIGGNIFFPTNATPMIIAHRAGAAAAPENTLAALSEAIEANADVAEIDVQQLGDGTLVVMHDTNFKRTAGKRLDVWDADYGMLQELNIHREPVPTLEEFIKKAKGRIRLMIELKATSHGKNIEQSTLRLIRKYDVQKQCMIASMDLDILRRVKELEPAMETVYISAILITSRYNLSFADGYSVETTSLSPGMALQARLQGKKIYGWTANSGYSIKKILRCGVDGLITDDPRLARRYMDQYGQNLLTEGITRLFYS